MMKKSLKRIIAFFCPVINRLPFNNRFKLRSNKIIFSDAKLTHCKVDLRGTGNVIKFCGKANVTNTTITVYGNNNLIEIGDNVLIRNGSFAIEDDGNNVIIGKGTRLTGSVHFACIEGTSISLGEDCLFSYEITLRTGDGHSIIDIEGNRTNPSTDIVIGNHVWVGHKATLGKGVYIADDNIVATAAVVTKRFENSNTIIAGIPAKVVKENINWKLERI